MPGVLDLVQGSPGRSSALFILAITGIIRTLVFHSLLLVGSCQLRSVRGSEFRLGASCVPEGLYTSVVDRLESPRMDVELAPRIIRSQIKVHEQFEDAAARLGPEASHERLVVTDRIGRLMEISATWVRCNRHDPAETQRKLYVAHSGHVSCTSRHMVDDCRTSGFGVSGASWATDIQRLPFTEIESMVLQPIPGMSRCPRSTSGSCHKRGCPWCRIHWVRRLAAHLLAVTDGHGMERVVFHEDYPRGWLKELRSQGIGFILLPTMGLDGRSSVVWVDVPGEPPLDLTSSDVLVGDIYLSIEAPGKMAWAESWRPSFR